MYKITKGQYNTVLAFAVILWLASIFGLLYVTEAIACDKTIMRLFLPLSWISLWFLSLHFLAIPFILVFYTIGWRNDRKQMNK
jgi:hypothetical protein